MDLERFRASQQAVGSVLERITDNMLDSCVDSSRDGPEYNSWHCNLLGNAT